MKGQKECKALEARQRKNSQIDQTQILAGEWLCLNRNGSSVPPPQKDKISVSPLTMMETMVLMVFLTTSGLLLVADRL